MEIVDMIAEDDKVMVIGKRTGTNTGVFGGLPPTGKTVTMYRMALYRLENGKIAEGWSIDDYLGQLQQLGFQIMPPT
jgi:predicted ester cyclase